MCGGGVDPVDPNAVGAANFGWNNLNQYTPYGSMEFTPPEVDSQGRPIGPGTMTQSVDPQILALQDAMMGLRGSALDRLGGMFGGGGFGPANIGWNGDPSSNPSPQPGYPWGPWGNMYGNGNAGGGRNTGDATRDNQKIGLLGGGGRYGPGGGHMPPPGGDSPPINDTPPRGFPGSQFANTPSNLNNLWYSDNAPALAYETGGLPGLLGAGDLQGERERVTQAKFDRLKGLLDPVFAEKDTALQQRMANRGMPVGAEEYNILSDQLGQQQNEAYTNAALDADLAGQQELMAMAGLSGQQRGQLYGEQVGNIGLQNQARSQAFGENMGVYDALMRGQLGFGQFGLQQQGQEYNQLASLLGLTGVPGAGGDMSQFFGPSAVNMNNAYGMNMQGQMSNANNQITGAGAFSGLLGLAGALGPSLLASSKHVKENFKEIDSDDILEKLGDLDVLSWNYVWDEDSEKRIGPMAEDFAEHFGTPATQVNGISTIDAISAIGVLMASVKSLTKKVKLLEERAEV
jgi:hypothetical protein